MKLLPATVTKKAKRVGRGYGSGRGGHTSGRGSKGQKARGDIPIRFEGTKTKKSLIKRTPLLRGRGKLKPLGQKTRVINLSDLADWPVKKPVTAENLAAAGLCYKGERVKILGNGEAQKTMKITGLEISKSAREKIKAAGGQTD